jgi:FKBP-type peptidyl-prolyl cis-trans isomerase FkpA
MNVSPSGLTFLDLRIGEGSMAEPGDRCSVFYTGWVHGSGTPFDGTPDRNEAFVFHLKKGQVIDGWLEGVVGMRVGGLRRLQVPARLAYGDEGREGVIPPGADLTFEIELLAVAQSRPDARLLIAPQTRVRWQGGTIEIYVPGDPRTVEATDADVLRLLHAFSTPSRRVEVATQFPDTSPEDLDAVVDELVAANVLVMPSQASPDETSDLATDEGASGPGPTRTLFVLPPNLTDLGELDLPAALLFLSSLAEQGGFATDFLMATSTPRLPPSPTRLFAGPSDDRLPPILFLQDFAEELLARIAHLRARGERPILGFSCFSSSLFASCMILGALVRGRYPDLPILAGGCHPTIDPESLNAEVGSQMKLLVGEDRWRPLAGSLFLKLDEATQAIAAHEDFVFDLVFTGRADRALLPALRTLAEEGKRPGRPEQVAAAPMDDEEMAGFRYDSTVLARLAKAHRALAPESAKPFPISFSFGCPYACTFCINSRTLERWQGMEPKVALETLAFLHLACGIHHFALMDANFGAKKSWRQAFFQGLAAMPWIEDIHIDTETAVLNWELDDYRVLDRLSLTLQVGVESCAPEILLRMGKSKSPERYLERLQALLETLAPRVDHISLMMILGYPGETHATLARTLAYLIDDCRVLSRNNVEICPQLYLPLIGTRACELTSEYAEHFGYRPNQDEWWNRNAADRFIGLRPSRTLSLETCSRLVHRIQCYYRGAAADSSTDEETVGKAFNLCETVNRSKFEQRRFRADLWRILDQTG